MSYYVSTFQPSQAGPVDVTQAFGFDAATYQSVQLLFAAPTTLLSADTYTMLVGASIASSSSQPQLQGAVIYVTVSMGVAAIYAGAPGISITTPLPAIPGQGFGGWYVYNSGSWQLVSTPSDSGDTETFAANATPISFTAGQTCTFALK